MVREWGIDIVERLWDGGVQYVQFMFWDIGAMAGVRYGARD